MAAGFNLQLTPGHALSQCRLGAKYHSHVASVGVTGITQSAGFVFQAPAISHRILPENRSATPPRTARSICRCHRSIFVVVHFRAHFSPASCGHVCETLV